MRIPPLPVGHSIRDTYTVVRFLGNGAFGSVYFVRHRYMGLQAMKVFSDDAAIDPLREAFVLSRLGHPNIIRLFEANEIEVAGIKSCYFTMEYIDGGTLADHTATANPALSDRVGLCLDIAAGLATAHSQVPPIVHRDLAPWNVLVARDPNRYVAKISDFGLARHVDVETRLTSAAGNFFFMPPEAFFGYESPASDVYAAAMVMYQTLTGHPAFTVGIGDEASPEEKRQAVKLSRQQTILAPSSAVPGLGGRWDELLVKAMAYEASDRFPTAVELEAALRAVCADTTNPLPAPAAVDELVLQALELSRQSVSLPEAVSLLETACRSDEKVRATYAATLDLWKRGIVQ